MRGNLYIVSTPIGNLEDLTFRALRILQEASVIAAEDTRRTQKLCSHYGIGTSLTSYHDFNKEEKTPILLKRMEEGSSIALVSDAGTPLISDPGYYLVTRAAASGFSVIPIPGPSAILAALTSSGLPTDSFIFLGFLPRKSGPKVRVLQSFMEEKKTIIFFETPHRLLTTLEDLRNTLGNRRIALARELTKSYEEIIRGTAEEVTDSCKNRVMKGEITLVVEGNREGKRKTVKEERN